MPDIQCKTDRVVARQHQPATLHLIAGLEDVRGFENNTDALQGHIIYVSLQDLVSSLVFSSDMKQVRRMDQDSVFRTPLEIRYGFRYFAIVR